MQSPVLATIQICWISQFRLQLTWTLLLGGHFWQNCTAVRVWSEFWLVATGWHVGVIISHSWLTRFAPSALSDRVVMRVCACLAEGYPRYAVWLNCPIIGSAAVKPRHMWRQSRHGTWCNHTIRYVVDVVGVGELSFKKPVTVKRLKPRPHCARWRASTPDRMNAR